jgi:hypothetical protein
MNSRRACVANRLKEQSMTSVYKGAAAMAVVASLGLATPVFAQGVGVGIKAGPVFADFSLDDPDDLDLDKRTGWQAGIFFGGNRAGTVGVMGEVNFIQKKTNFIPDVGDPFEVKISYIQVPILLRINGGSRTREGVNVYGIVGPAFDIKISEDIGDIDLDEPFEGLDIGIMAGAGVEITRFIIEGRYTWGLRRINKTLTDTSDIKTRSFAVLFGVRFN